MALQMALHVSNQSVTQTISVFKLLRFTIDHTQSAAALDIEIKVMTAGYNFMHLILDINLFFCIILVLENTFWLGAWKAIVLTVKKKTETLISI